MRLARRGARTNESSREVGLRGLDAVSRFEQHHCRIDDEGFRGEHGEIDSQSNEEENWDERCAIVLPPWLARGVWLPDDGDVLLPCEEAIQTVAQPARSGDRQGESRALAEGQPGFGLDSRCEVAG